ncbi:DUF2304 domain-containing protein [Nocardioides seonyuensis]|uniref:DUF2304 domain-containing protein n=1 Tax=Nocardioides seonyuensis TaxID=2518371 RepID=A0A4P7IF43_9ACTN|nr:DUF2304 domain-containing protein [Nocardioides seonyuensis]QBX54301.1 DUF2304 domain-containing protein [Nocardioides seonyuensis]
MTNATVLGAVASLIIIVTLFEMLRRHRLREKYALIWFLIAVGALVTSLAPGAVAALADALGVVLPVNLLFFLGSLVLLAMSLQHSYELGRLEERTRTLAEEVALLRLQSDTDHPGNGDRDDEVDQP